MKRVRLAVLFLMVAVLLASTPLLAAPKPEPPPDFVLSPVGDEPNASGEASLTWKYVKPYPMCCGDLKVSCKGLTPGATYRIDHYAHWVGQDPDTGEPEYGYSYQTVFQTTTDKQGRLNGQGEVIHAGWRVYAEDVLVYRVEASGEFLVLVGSRYNPY